MLKYCLDEQKATTGIRSSMEMAMLADLRTSWLLDYMSVWTQLARYKSTASPLPLTADVF